MTRLTFPDEGSRLLYDPATGFLLPVNTRVYLYLDSAATLPALDLLDAAGSAVTSGYIASDAYKRLPLFSGPDGVDTLYAVVSGTGPITPIYARDDDRLDALSTRVAAVEASAPSTAVHTVNGHTGTSVTVTKGDVGLGNVDNTSDANKPVSTAQAAADAATLTSAQTYADGKVTALVNSAPAILDTLGEIATQLQSDESAATALATTVAAKLAKSANLSDVTDAGTSRANLHVPQLPAAQCCSTTNQTLSGLPTIDGYVTQNSDLVLLTGQTTASQNGLWQLPASGTGAWSRPTAFPSGMQLRGRTCLVVAGTARAGTEWALLATALVTVDTTAQIWRQVSSGAYLPALRPATFVALGDSTSVVPGAGVTYPELLCRLSDGRFTIAATGGVAGNTTAQMLARVQTDAVAYAPSYCIVLGGTNDIGGGSFSLATTAANLTAIYSALLAAGIKPIAGTITPRNANADLANVRDLNNWIRGYCAKTGIPVIDFHAALVDPATGYYTTGLNADTVHPNADGALVMARAALSVLATNELWTPRPAPMLPNAFNLSAWQGGSSETGALLTVNPLMTDSNADAIPDNWSLLTSNSNNFLTSCSPGVVTDPRFTGKAIKWRLVAQSGFQTMRQQVQSRWAVGDRIRYVFRVATEGMTGTTGAGNGFLASIAFAGVGTTEYAMNQWVSDLPDGETFVYDTVIPVGTTAVTAQFTAQLNGGSGRVYFGQVGVINKTTLGL